MISISTENNVLVFTYETVFINLCTKFFYQIHELFLYKNLESKFDLVSENFKVSPRSLFEPS